MTKPTATSSNQIQQEAPVSTQPAAGPEGLVTPENQTVVKEASTVRGAWPAFLVWAAMFVILCLQAFLDLIISLFR